MSDTSARLLAKKWAYEHEALRLKLYKCTSEKWTIGVGRNIEDNGISADEADYMLENDLNSVFKDLERFDFWPRLCAVRQAVLADMRLNLGMPRLAGFHKMLAALRVADYAGAAKEMEDSAWFRQVGKRAKTLQKIMLTGVV